MKRTFTLIICILVLQIVKASSTTPIALHSMLQVGQLKNTFEPVQADTIIVPVVNKPAPLNYQSGLYKRRLDSIKKEVPLDYNEFVQSYIDIYAHNRDEMAHVLGLTKYYFPIYEKAFRDAGIPEEIKYLSIVESKLDPYAVSRVGATGAWQFMFTTARMYGLNMDDYVDERRDPIQASYAAAAYLKDAYQEFGDWLLAIASYNCGKSNVERAIQKAGASDFWSIRQYLPNETRGYVPAYIAVTYLMNYYSKHNIIPQLYAYSLKTDTVLVNKYIALSAVSKALNLDIKQLAFLNPSYKRQIVNGTDKAPRRLVIPQVEKIQYSALYEALNNTNVVATLPQLLNVSYHDKKAGEMPKYHKVRKGETLGDIADNFGVEVQDLKVWNHLHSNKAVIGQKLKLSGASGLTDDQPVKKQTNYITYKVKTGDTLRGIAARFDGATVENIRSLNGLKKGQLQPGMTIKINKG
jgi:membrane-bound lytic murein transglycosylase D